MMEIGRSCGGCIVIQEISISDDCILLLPKYLTTIDDGGEVY